MNNNYKKYFTKHSIQFNKNAHNLTFSEVMFTLFKTYGQITTIKGKKNMDF